MSKHIHNIISAPLTQSPDWEKFYNDQGFLSEERIELCKKILPFLYEGENPITSLEDISVAQLLTCLNYWCLIVLPLRNLIITECLTKLMKQYFLQHELENE